GRSTPCGTTGHSRIDGGERRTTARRNSGDIPMTRRRSPASMLCILTIVYFFLAVMPPDPEMIQVGDANWQGPQWRRMVQGAVRAVGVVEVLVLPQDHHQVALIPDQGPVQQKMVVAWRAGVDARVCRVGPRVRGMRPIGRHRAVRRATAAE